MALRLSGAHYSLETALAEENNLLLALRRSSLTAKLYDDLWSQRKAIQAIVACHLGLASDSQCIVEPPDQWIKGRFNICVFLRVEDNAGYLSRKVFRCPMPHKVGDFYDAVDEKIRAEVANYVWVEERCPEIPTPHLIGFGFGTAEQYTHRRHLPLFRRWISQATRLAKSIMYRHLQTSAYAQRSSPVVFSHPYMLLEYIAPETGRMLSNTWKKFRDDAVKRENLYRGLSRIMLSFARSPHDHIGSLRFDEGGYISIATRPLLCANVILENEGAPRAVLSVYTRTYTFISDMLRFRDEAFACQPNAVHDEEDCRLQMAYAVTLKAVMSSLVDVHRDGPFLLQHTDLHASNIFVDEHWNITAVIDLEYVCALPPAMLEVPYWLSADYIDEVAHNSQESMEIREAFLRVLDEEQRRGQMHHRVAIGTEILKAWQSGACWFFHCLTSVNATPGIIERHIYPMFGFHPSLSQFKHFNDAQSHFWAKDTTLFVEQKVRDKKQYDIDLRAHFESQMNGSSAGTQFAVRSLMSSS